MRHKPEESVEAMRARARQRIGHVGAFEILDRVGRILCLTVGGVLGVGFAVYGTQPADAWMLWSAGHSALYYGDVWSLSARYIYPPPLAQLLAPFPWPVFIVPWMLLVFASLWYATRWLSGPIVLVGAVAWAGGGMAGPLASPTLFSATGNPQAVVAAAIIVGFRQPAAWAFPILSKIGPGVGLLWFVFRREWRHLAIALGVTFAVVAASFVVSPTSWAEFVRFAIANHATPSPVPAVPVPLLVRLPMSVALIWWGAHTDRPWTVLVGVGWASLALYEWSYLIPWLAAFVMLVDARRARAPVAAAAAIPGQHRPGCKPTT